MNTRILLPRYTYTTPKPEDYKEYYTYNFCCINCGKYNGVYVLKGIKIESIKILCNNCECEIKS